MTKEFNIVDHVIAELAGDVPVQGFGVGGDVDLDYADVLGNYSTSVDPYSAKGGNKAILGKAAAKAAAAVAAGMSNIGGYDDGRAWEMVPEAGGKGSVNDQINKQGIIDAYLADLTNLTSRLSSDEGTAALDTKVTNAVDAYLADNPDVDITTLTSNWAQSTGETEASCNAKGLFALLTPVCTKSNYCNYCNYCNYRCRECGYRRVYK